MSRNMSIEQYFESNAQNKIKKTVKTPLQGILLLVYGGLAILINALLHTSTVGFLSPLFIMISIVFFIWGALATFIRKTYYVDLSSKNKIKFHELFYDNKEHDRLINIVESGNFHELKSLHKSVQDGIKLRVATNKDKSLCFVQVLTYIPYEYALSTPVREVPQDQASHLFMHMM